MGLSREVRIALPPFPGLLVDEGPCHVAALDISKHVRFHGIEKILQVAFLWELVVGASGRWKEEYGG
jgi:hypothetical protein